MSVFARCALFGFCGLLLSVAPVGAADPSSEGHPHKWQAVEKSLVDYVNDGFDLKSVAYDPSAADPKTGTPAVHYFLQKGTLVVRCDFRLRNQTSYYWCAELTAPRAAQ